MMGKSHLLLGAAGWLALAPGLKLAGIELGPAELGAGTVVAAGAAMLPDLDHPKATVSSSLGPVSRIISKGMARSLGGHRNGSHSLLFALLVSAGLLALLSGDSGLAIISGFLVCLLASSLMLRTLTEADGISCAILSAIIAALIISIVGVEAGWLVSAVLIGILLHDLGDLLTPMGIPPLWPVSRQRVRLPIIARTGNLTEKLLSGVIGLAASALFVSSVLVPLWPDQIRSGPERGIAQPSNSAATEATSHR